MRVLGIESTCDETACAVVRDGREILSNVIASQIDLHREYGGVVPELSCRRHVDVIIPVIQQALTDAQVSLTDIDLIAVARGPGLVGALLIGMNSAKALALALNKPFVGVNHIEAHLYASLMTSEAPPTFPCLGVVVSGGHTALVLIRKLGDYQLLGQTVDDAIGESFDKVAKMMGLPYPGGPEIEQLALTGNPKRFHFKAGTVKGYPLDFSYSGLKTAVLYAIKGPASKPNSPLLIEEADKKDVAASFQEAAFQDVLHKALAAAGEYGCDTLVFGGGVTNSNRLRQVFADNASQYTLIWPPKGLSLDNAAMIAGLGYHKFQERGADPLSLEVLTRMPL